MSRQRQIQSKEDRLLSFSDSVIPIMSTLGRRLTKFPGNSSVNSLRKRHAEGEPEDRTSKIPKAPELLQVQKRTHPPAIPLKTNLSSQQFTASTRFPKRTDNTSHQRVAICQKGNPQQKYYIILRENQAGQVTVAYKNEIEHPILAVKEHVCGESTSVKNLTRCSHKNLVCLYDAYLKTTIFI